MIPWTSTTSKQTITPKIKIAVEEETITTIATLLTTIATIPTTIVTKTTHTTTGCPHPSPRLDQPPPSIAGFLYLRGLQY